MAHRLTHCDMIAPNFIICVGLIILQMCVEYSWPLIKLYCQSIIRVEIVSDLVKECVW